MPHAKYWQPVNDRLKKSSLLVAVAKLQSMQADCRRNLHFIIATAAVPESACLRVMSWTAARQLAHRRASPCLCPSSLALPGILETYLLVSLVGLQRLSQLGLLV